MKNYCKSEAGIGSQAFLAIKSQEIGLVSNQGEGLFVDVDQGIGSQGPW